MGGVPREEYVEMVEILGNEVRSAAERGSAPGDGRERLTVSAASQSGRGPLAGIRVLDLSGLGPAPFATMMLADFGASVLSVRRPDPMPFDPAAAMSRGKDAIGLDLRIARRAGRGAPAGAIGGRPGRGLPPRRDGTARPRPRTAAGGQSGPDLCAPDRLGADRPLCDARRPRHQLSRHFRRARRHRRGRADGAARPARRSRQRLLHADDRHADGAGRAPADRPRPGGRRGDRRRRRLHARRRCSASSSSACGTATRAIRCSAARRPFTASICAPTARWFSVGAIEQKFYAAMLHILGLDDVDPLGAGADGPGPMAGACANGSPPSSGPGRRQNGPSCSRAIDACGAPVLDLDELAADPHNAARGNGDGGRRGRAHRRARAAPVRASRAGHRDQSAPGPAGDGDPRRGRLRRRTRSTP